MTNQSSGSGGGFNPLGGFAAMRGNRTVFAVFLLVSLGIILHWVWEVMVAAIESGGGIEFGAWQIIIARIVVSLIVGLIIVAGVWKQLQGVDPAIRAFLAISQGFATDALTAPVADPGS